MNLTDLGAFLNVLVGGVFVAVLTAAVAAYRRIKAGEIVDDDAVIARLDGDNVKIREQNTALLIQVETERKNRWAAEDMAAFYRRQLTACGVTPIPSNEDRSRHDN